MSRAVGRMQGESDTIEICGLRAHGRHGVYAEEQQQGQTFVVDMSLETDHRPAARSDDLSDTIHYGELAEEVAAAVRDTRYDLIEALADHLAQLALRHAAVRRVTVRVAKPDAPIDVELDEVAVVVIRP